MRRISGFTNIKLQQQKTVNESRLENNQGNVFFWLSTALQFYLNKKNALLWIMWDIKVEV